MDKRLKVILAITLAAILAVGLAISGCDGGVPDGDGPDGNGSDMSGVSTIIGVSEGSASDIQLGGPAPDFWFETAQGQLTYLSDLKGKIVLVNFWAIWCSPCRSEMPYMQQIYEEWSEEELVVLAINVGDSSDDVADFLQDNGLFFPVLLDSEGEVAIRYGVPGLPSTIIIDKEGLLQEAKVGAFQSTEEIESILNQLN